MRTTVLLMVAGVAVFWAGATQSQTAAVQPKPAEGAQPAAAAERPFNGPVYVQSKVGAQVMPVAHTLEKAEVRRVGGRSFVVGTVMKDPPKQLTDENFIVGETVWVPLDDVGQMIELTPRPKP